MARLGGCAALRLCLWLQGGKCKIVGIMWSDEPYFTAAKDQFGKMEVGRDWVVDRALA